MSEPRPGPLRAGPAYLAAADLSALIAFAVIGTISHHQRLSLRSLASTLGPLVVAWFAAAALIGIYRSSTLSRLAVNWFLAVTAGVLVRRAILGHPNGRGLVVFEVVALSTVALLLAAGRLVLVLALRLRPSKPAGGGSAGSSRR